VDAASTLPGTEQVPTLSRRHAGGSESARGLLLTILGELVLPAGGSALTSAFIDVLGRLGVEEKATRQALMRTAGDGWLAAQRQGRRTVWTLSPDGQRQLTDGAERIYGFHGVQRDWDGRWLLVLARAPETERAARHVLRTRLTWAGFGSPAPGIWISTHLDRAAEAERVLDEAGLREDAQIFYAEHHSGGMPAMVRQAWDLEAIEQRYEEFLAEFSGEPLADPMVRTIQLVHTWRRFPQVDPELPAELLPARWSGTRAAELFRRHHEPWAAAARAEWRRIGEVAPLRS
jgi:phenylacetic acid degradation operon negative regulatory protein